MNIVTPNKDPNPYTTPNAPQTCNRESQEGPTLLFSDADLKELRVGTQRANERAAWFEPYIWPVIASSAASYQFWMCWAASQSSGVSLSELLTHDGAGFPADTYDGGLVRMFDRLVTGFFILTAGGFMYFIALARRKRDLQNARFHQTMLTAGLVPVDTDSKQSQIGG